MSEHLSSEELVQRLNTVGIKGGIKDSTAMLTTVAFDVYSDRNGDRPDVRLNLM